MKATPSSSSSSFIFLFLFFSNTGNRSSCSGNHERDCPDSGSSYQYTDSGGECSVLAETMFYVLAGNRAKFW
jgi:hypothetical protein